MFDMGEIVGIYTYELETDDVQLEPMLMKIELNCSCLRSRVKILQN